MPPKKKASKSSPPTPPEPKKPARGRATKGPTAARRPSRPERGKETTPAPERGKETTGTKAPEQGKQVPVPPERRPIGTKDKPGVLARVAQPKPGATYHRWVLAEFIGALVLAVLGSVLSPRKRADGQPTWVHLIVQLTAVAGVFFVLALLSASDRLGKISAAFGFLVFLGVLLNSADAVRKMAAVFAPTKAGAAAPEQGAEGAG